MANLGLLSLDTQKCFDTRKESLETRTESECFEHFLDCDKTFFKCLKLNGPRSRSLSIVFGHGFLQRGLLSFSTRQLANQMAGFQ